MSEVKRVRYFKHEFLNAADFEVEQEYHRSVRHRHNRNFHTWGICHGLEVDFTPGQETRLETKVMVSTGTAVDNDGKEIVLAESRVIDFNQPKYEKGKSYYITISWDEQQGEPKQEEEFKRWEEEPVIDASKKDPPEHPEITLVLAKVTLGDDESKTIAAIDHSHSRYAALELGDKTVTTAKILDGAVTEAKIADGSITRVKIADSSVTNAKLYDGSVNEDKLSASVKSKLVTNGDNHTHSAADVGALPITGGEVNGNVHVLGTLLGAAKDESGNQLKIVCGKTPEGNTNWMQNSSDGLYVDVSVPGFKYTPYYFVNVHGNYGNWMLTGGSSAYQRTNTGFRIWVKYTGSITPDLANQYIWHVQWLAIGT